MATNRQSHEPAAATPVPPGMRWLGQRLAALRLPLRANLRPTFDARLIEAVGVLTGEPRDRAAALLAHSLQGNKEFQRDYDALAAATPAHLQRQLDSIALPQVDELQIALAERTRPLVIALVHAGNFVSGLLRLLPNIPAARDVLLIARPAPSSREMAVCAHAARLGTTIRILRLAERPLLPALQALREQAVVVVMCDVPPSFWRADTARQSLAETTLFGHPAWLPEGPAALAVAARALILPVICHSARGQRQIRCAPLIDAAPMTGWPATAPASDAPVTPLRRAAVQRVHHALAATVESWLIRYREDWLLWHHLPSYFQPPAVNTQTNRKALAAQPPTATGRESDIAFRNMDRSALSQRDAHGNASLRSEMIGSIRRNG